MNEDNEDNDQLWDELNRVVRSTGLDARAIALKAIVPVDAVEAFIDDSAAELTDDQAMRLAVFTSKARDNALGLGLTMLREAAGMSGAEVERATAISRFSVSKYERGERVPQIDALLVLWREYRRQIDEDDLDVPRDMFEAVCAGELGKIREWLEGVA